MASGDVLYWVIGVVAVLFLYVAVKGGSPFAKLVKFLMWPLKMLWKLVTWLWSKAVSLLPAKSAAVVSADQKKVATQATSLWGKLTAVLRGHNYDPGSHTWAWWLERGIPVLALWLVTLFAAEHHGLMNSYSSSARFGADRIQSAWKERALKCETKFADYFTREPTSSPPSPPPGSASSMIAPLTSMIPGFAAKPDVKSHVKHYTKVPVHESVSVR
jgi:hypothetical protein